MKHHFQLKMIFSAPRGAVALVQAWFFTALPQTRDHPKLLLHEIVRQSQGASNTTHPLYSENILFQLLTLAHKFILQTVTSLTARSLVICPITNGSLPCKQLSVALVIRLKILCVQ